MRDFTTDRPDTTESPFTVDAGHVQIELSVADHAFDRDGAVRTRTFDVFPVNVKLGLANRIDIQFVFTPYQRVLSRTGTARTVASGFGDASEMRLKINLWGDDPAADGGGTAFALLQFVKVPTGSAGLGNGHVEGGLILPLAIDLPRGFSLGTMAEFDWTYDGDRHDYGLDVIHSATLGRRIAGPLEGYVEYVDAAPRPGGSGYRAIASTGLTYGFKPDWNVDAGATFGLSGRTDDAAVFAGTSLRF